MAEISNDRLSRPRSAADQRISEARDSSPWWRSRFACYFARAPIGDGQTTGAPTT